MNETAMARWERRIANAALIYVVVVGVTLLVWNAASGGLVEGWYAEYVGDDGRFSGSGEWRSEEGSAFQLFALFLGTWVYPLAVVSAVGHARRARQDARRRRSVAWACISLAILAAFVRLGVFGAVTRF